MNFTYEKRYGQLEAGDIDRSRSLSGYPHHAIQQLPLYLSPLRFALTKASFKTILSIGEPNLITQRRKLLCIELLPSRRDLKISQN